MDGGIDDVGMRLTPGTLASECLMYNIDMEGLKALCLAG